ncbi:MAG: hypothetical protein ACE14M_10565 [Terriglobales bacterium]
MRFLPILLLTTALFAQKPAPRTVEPDDGMLTGSVYRSDYFHFTYTIPADLQVLPDFLAPEEDAEHRSFVLLAAYAKPQNENANENAARPGLVIMADRARDYAPLPDGKAYLDKVTLPLVTRQGYELLHGAREHIIAGEKFYRADFSKNGVHQSFVVTVLRRYAVGFNLVGASAAEIERLFESLQSLKFSAPPAAPKRAAPKPAQ